MTPSLILEPSKAATAVNAAGKFFLVAAEAEFVSTKSDDTGVRFVIWNEDIGGWDTQAFFDTDALLIEEDVYDALSAFEDFRVFEANIAGAVGADVTDKFDPDEDDDESDDESDDEDDDEDDE